MVSLPLSTFSFEFSATCSSLLSPPNNLLCFPTSRIFTTTSPNARTSSFCTAHRFSATNTNCFNGIAASKIRVRQPHICRASPEGVPSELVEDPKFVPLNADDPRYGPPALLLLGFKAEETLKIQQFLQELDGEFLKVIHCTEEMITRPLWEAVTTEQPDLKSVEIAKSLPRMCILSGLSGEEMMVFIDAFPDTGLEPAVFAALVPNSANKLLQEVMEEIMGDHERLSANQSDSS